ncbi:putative ribonuclease H-like domain-containing protein [Tanacetum coccineum]
MTKINKEHGLISSVQKLKKTNHKDFQNCLFTCYLSQMEPKKPVQALKDPSWVEAMQDELLQYKLLNVWTLVDLPKDKWAIEEGIDYDEVFAPVARIEAIRLFLAYASFKDFVVYQMDVKSAFIYRKIEEEVYVCQPPGFEDPDFPDKVYKKSDGIFISQDKYVADILNFFDFSTIKTASTLMEPNKALVKDAEAEDVDVHLYRSMIGSLMYLTASRPEITFAVCACARFQVTLKTSHLHVVKRIFRYLKGQPKLGLWYPRDSPFDLEAYSDNDYARTSLDRKSTTGGCQFLGKRLISWQCKKQTIVANSTTEAEYVTAASFCGQVAKIYSVWDSQVVSEPVRNSEETVKNQFTHSQKPKVDKKELGYGFTARACFVCGSLNHLIRDCDFHEKRMAKKAELNNGLNRNSGQREIRPIWNNVHRVNKQNQFVPTAVLTRTGKIPVNTARASGTKNVSTARHSFNRQAILTSTAMKVNTVKPIVNGVRPANVFQKTHSPSSRPFKKTTVLRTNFLKQKVNTAKVHVVSDVGGKKETVVKPSAGCNWRPQRYNWHNVSKYNGGSSLRNYFTFKDPLGRLKPKQAWVPKRN